MWSLFPGTDLTAVMIFDVLKLVQHGVCYDSEKLHVYLR